MNDYGYIDRKVYVYWIKNRFFKVRILLRKKEMIIFSYGDYLLIQILNVMFEMYLLKLFENIFINNCL